MSRNVTWGEDEHQVLEEDADHEHQQLALPPSTTAAASASASSSGGLQCPDCGSREIEQQDASGRTVCVECGMVLEENAIAFSVEFVEGAGGATNMVGCVNVATIKMAKKIHMNAQPNNLTSIIMSFAFIFSL